MMKNRSTYLTLVLLLTIGVITVVSFSIGCTQQEEAPAGSSNNTSVEPTENASAEPEETVSAGSSGGSGSSESAESSGSTESTDNFGMTDKIIGELKPISADNITNIEWQWTSFQDSDTPDSPVTVSSPENYTLVFLADGTYNLKSDCNTGSGTYTLEGNNLTLGDPVVTLIDCGPESMSVEYTSLLPSVEAVALEDGQLVLYPGNEGDKMFFVNGGKAEQ